MSELKDLLKHINNQNATVDEIDKVASEVYLGKIEIPSNLSIESTLKEIQDMSTRLYKTLENYPRDTIIQTKIISLLEMKTRILGLTKVDLSVQEMIDAEINSYKKRVMEIACHYVKPEIMTEIAERLTKEGL